MLWTVSPLTILTKTNTKIIFNKKNIYKWTKFTTPNYKVVNLIERNGAPKNVKENITKAEADDIAGKLKEAGAEIEII
jgi:Ribosomal protein L7/L12 C-terminal domain